MKKYIRSAETSGNPYADAYYQIMNTLDDIALSGRFPTKSEKEKLDRLLPQAGGTIEDIADANDCYNEHDELCSNWDEMVSALHILFEHGERGPIKSNRTIKADTQYAELSDDEFKELVRQYRDSGATWTYIVAELKGTYGLDMAKAVADAVDLWRIWNGF